jgi:glutaconyl-CoA/methylmalonyl-CoA decarboxylase subunit gamma
MRLKVKVGNQTFDVEVGDLKERPIMATVDGEIFEVWPETKAAYTTVSTSRTTIITKERPTPNKETSSESIPTVPTSQKLKYVKAPIPGVITLISINAGDYVDVGQELCKLEAMKMNNSVRSTHAGVISSIQISIGQQVKHGDILMEYAED